MTALAIDGTALVLGAGAGIGRAATHALAAAGAHVVCVDRDLDAADGVADEVDGTAMAVDVTDPDALTVLLRDVAAAHPDLGAVVDIVGEADIAPLAEMDWATRWQRQLITLLSHGAVVMQRAPEVLPAGGSIVMVGSISGDRAVPGQAVYGSAKAALHQLVRSAGVELARAGIRVNAVAPGPTKTARLSAALTADKWAAIDRAMPLGRAATPEEIAGPIAFLVSPLAAAVTSHVLVVDGGLGTVTEIPGVWELPRDEHGTPSTSALHPDDQLGARP